MAEFSDGMQAIGFSKAESGVLKESPKAAPLLAKARGSRLGELAGDL